MNKDNAKDYLPLVQALAEGKQIQIRDHGGWHDETNPNFVLEIERYRIKPEPKLRPWKRDEFPLEAQFRVKNGYGARNKAISVSDCHGVAFCQNGCIVYHSFRWLLEFAEHSTDNGKTWKPCGVEE